MICFFIFAKRKKQSFCDLRSHEAEVSLTDADGSHPTRACAFESWRAVSNHVVWLALAHAHTAFAR
jgi:hypothetical protein